MTFLSKLDGYTPPPAPKPPTPDEARRERMLACYRLAQERANRTGDRHEVWMRRGAIQGAEFIAFRVEGVHDPESAKADPLYLSGKRQPPQAAGSDHRGGYDFIGYADPDPKPAPKPSTLALDASGRVVGASDDLFRDLGALLPRGAGPL